MTSPPPVENRSQCSAEDLWAILQAAQDIRYYNAQGRYRMLRRKLTKIIELASHARAETPISDRDA